MKTKRNQGGTHPEPVQFRSGSGPLSTKSRGPEPEFEYPTDPVTIYHLEHAKARQRLEAKRKVEMATVGKAFKAMQAREAELRRGGRPKGSKRGAYPIATAKPGRPRLALTRDPIPDLTACLSEFYGR